MNYEGVLPGPGGHRHRRDDPRHLLELRRRGHDRAFGPAGAGPPPQGGVSVDSSVARRLMETLATAESRSETDGVLESADNPEVPVSVVTAPLFARDGTVEAAVAVVRDLTRLRQLEAEVRRGETLAAAGRMAVGFAHEIRNPLGAIRGPCSSSPRAGGRASPARVHRRGPRRGGPRQPDHRDAPRPGAAGEGARGAPQPAPAPGAGAAGERGERRRPPGGARPPLRSEPPAHPRRRDASCRSSTTWCATRWRRCRAAAASRWSRACR
jgi:hypothetical protein